MQVFFGIHHDLVSELLSLFSASISVEDITRHVRELFTSIGQHFEQTGRA